MICRTFEEDVGDSFGIFWTGGTDLNRHLVIDVAHAKQDTPEIQNQYARIRTNQSLVYVQPARSR
jgi:hypothetical protein